MGRRLFADGERECALHRFLLTPVCVVSCAGGGRFAIVVLFPLASRCGLGRPGKRGVCCAIVDCR